MAIPTTQKALVYDEPGTISTKVVDLAVPDPGPGEWSTLPHPTPAGQVGGHEGVGKVFKLGPGAETAGLSVGDRVGVKWISSACGHCEPCQAGSDGLCFNQKISGYYTPGTFQQYVTGPADYVTRIPEQLDSAEAAPLLCGGMTVYAALRRSQARSGQWVVVTGAGGGLGHLAVQLASRGMGLRVVGVDHASKADLVRSSGAEHFVDFTQFRKDDDDAGAGITAHVKKLCGGLGAHAVIACTASNEAYAQALGFLRFNGTLVCVGLPEHAAVAIATASPGVMVANQFTICGSAVGNRRDAIETLDFAARGVIKSHVRVEKMSELTRVFEEMDQGKLQGRVVLELM
ncbi:alcohol dehydrogenase II [Metarhizium anisopliae]|nr:alcohol dehydrogenase II [Metarhizium anisopliae]